MGYEFLSDPVNGFLRIHVIGVMREGFDAEKIWSSSLELYLPSPSAAKQDPSGKSLAESQKAAAPWNADA